ncbi:tyrosine-type recombinase/integrase [Candidatus Dojkabacteria bacterium]|nr:tyrosine-type recombinase/integrase [Candidatus Dojkabacteria bacterium]
MIEATKANKAGDCTVYVEVSVSNKGEKKKTVRIPTSIKVNADSWSAKSQSIIRGKSKDYYKVNQMLLAQKDLVMEIIAELSQRGKYQLSEIKQRYSDKTAPVTLSFFDIYDEFLKVKNMSMTRNGIKDFKTLKTHLLGFEKERGSKIILSEIDLTFFEKFENYLSKLKIARKAKDSDEVEKIPFADSTILKNLQTLRVFLNGQQDRGLPVNMSYKKFKIRSKPVPALVTLEPEEYKLLLAKVDNERLEKVRQLFVLQCATGLRYSDVIKIRKNHVRDNTIFMNSTKTRQKLQIPLNDNSKEILSACNYDTSTIAISNQKYNDYIKELCELVGINQSFVKTSYRGNKEFPEDLKKYEIMSSHHGRRFFITQNLINGARPEVIMSMTGHVDFRSFSKYIAVTDRSRVNAMELWSKTFGKTQ